MLEKEMSLEDREEVKMTSTFLRGFASMRDSFVRMGSRLSCTH